MTDSIKEPPLFALRSDSQDFRIVEGFQHETNVDSSQGDQLEESRRMKRDSLTSKDRNRIQLEVSCRGSGVKKHKKAIEKEPTVVRLTFGKEKRGVGDKEGYFLRRNAASERRISVA